MAHGGGWKLHVTVHRDLATAWLHNSVGPGQGFAEATPTEHGPTHDLVARVMALLDALEGERP